MNIHESHQPVPNGEVKHFNTGKAVVRLCAGEPAEFVFGPTFGWPLTPLTSYDLEGVYLGMGGYEKAITRTLTVAASHDVATHLSQRPLNVIPYAKPYFLEDKISETTIMDSLMPIWYAMSGETDDIIRHAQKPTFTAVVTACDALVTFTSEAGLKIIQEKLDRGLPSLSERGEAYLSLLENTYINHFGVNPTIADLEKLAINSYAIFGQPAAGDFRFQGDFRNKFEQYDRRIKNISRHFSYIDEKFELKIKEDGKRVVKPTKEEIEVLFTNYYPVKENDEVKTGCPANVGVKITSQEAANDSSDSLILAMLKRFSERVKFQAQVLSVV